MKEKCITADTAAAVNILNTFSEDGNDVSGAIFCCINMLFPLCCSHYIAAKTQNHPFLSEEKYMRY